MIIYFVFLSLAPYVGFLYIFINKQLGFRAYSCLVDCGDIGDQTQYLRFGVKYPNLYYSVLVNNS